MKIANFFYQEIKYLRKKPIKFCVTKFVFLETSYISSKRIQISTSWPKRLKSKEKVEIKTNVDWQRITKHTSSHLYRIAVLEDLAKFTGKTCAEVSF